MTRGGINGNFLRGGKTIRREQGNLLIPGDIAWQATGLLNLQRSTLAQLSSLASSSADAGQMSLRLTRTKRLNCKGQNAFLRDPQ